LKTGEFDFGKTEQIEVLNTQGMISFLERENFTPIVINLRCDKCSYSITVGKISVEYLKVLIDRPKASGDMYA
jgi:hypothetical protein